MSFPLPEASLRWREVDCFVFFFILVLNNLSTSGHRDRPGLPEALRWHIIRTISGHDYRHRVEEGQCRTITIIDGAQQAAVSWLCVYVVVYGFLRHDTITRAQHYYVNGQGNVFARTEMCLPKLKK